MVLNVLNEDDEDIMFIQDAHEIALALCRLCVSGYYRCGGTTPVGPRGVVYISVYGTTPITIEAAGPAAPQTSHFVGGQIERRRLGLRNASPPASVGIFFSNGEKAKCFGGPGPSARKHLYSLKSLDCLNAAEELIKDRRAHVSMAFGRRAGGNFKLPWRARRKSCVVIVDTLNDVDNDSIVLWEVYKTALDRIGQCTTGEHKLGGIETVGPKKVVHVFVLGIGPPHRVSAPALPAPIHVVARAQIENGELGLLNTTSSQTTAPPTLTMASTTNVSTLHGIPECFHPPTLRERAVPISNFVDCEEATREIVGTRPRTHIYVFSRKPSTDPDHYQLPATFRIRSCVIHLDMENESAEDAVRLSYVESTAWVLAHKCSGLEVPEEKWGGTVTVKVGANDLIRVWVYGMLAPSSQGPSLTPISSSLESEK